MSCFGVSESLILSGALLVINGRVTEGFVSMFLGAFSGFARYTVWFGNNNKKS